MHVISHTITLYVWKPEFISLFSFWENWDLAKYFAWLYLYQISSTGDSFETIYSSYRCLVYFHKKHFLSSLFLSYHVLQRFLITSFESRLMTFLISTSVYNLFQNGFLRSLASDWLTLGHDPQWWYVIGGISLKLTHLSKHMAARMAIYLMLEGLMKEYFNFDVVT